MSKTASSLNAFLNGLNWGWRLIGTALCFTFFGLGGLFLGVLFFSIGLFIPKGSTRHILFSRTCINLCFRFFLRFSTIWGVFTLKITGADTFRQDRGCVIVANHPTLLDYVIIASLMPSMDCLVKGRLLHNPFVKRAITGAGYLLNSEGETLLPEANQRLNEGYNLLIFPEGTRTDPAKEFTLQRGAANIAIRCQKNLRLIHIHCTEDILRKGQKWYNVPRKKPIFYIDVGNLVLIDTFLANDQPETLQVRHLTNTLTHLLRNNPNSR